MINLIVYKPALYFSVLLHKELEFLFKNYYTQAHLQFVPIFRRLCHYIKYNPH